MKNELEILRKQVKQLQFYAMAVSILIILVAMASFTGFNEKTGIIRAKGIIIEDSTGRDRILIGAPIPASANRVRTDTGLVRRFWANTYKNPEQFMQWYNNYYNSGIGMVVMNEKGFDRVMVGDKLADPNSGKRQFEAAGILWNDQEGWEKGGAGVNTTTDGKSRSVMGVDNANGEAAHIIALEDGTNAIAIGGEDGLMLIGFSKKGGSFFRNKESFTGIKFFSTDGKLVWEQKMNKP